MVTTKLFYGFRKEYVPWLLLYVLANFVSTVVMYGSNELIGDVEGTKLFDQQALILASLLIIFFYFFIQVTFYDLSTKLRMPKIIYPIIRDNEKRVMGIIILVLQIMFLVFNLKGGVNIAGSKTETTDLIGFLWIFMPVDMLFLIYYSIYRDSSYFKYNVGIYLVSNILRGWSGIFLYIMFFEWCRAYRQKKIKVKLILILIIIVIACYPLLLSLKWVIRGSGGNINVITIFELFLTNIKSIDYITLFNAGMTQLLGRLQHVSSVVEIIHYKDILQYDYDRGLILPFWQDGLPQLAIRKLLGIESGPAVGVALTGYLFPEGNFELGSWNTHVGFTGWFFIAPYQIVFYFLYMGGLCLISSFLMKQLSFKQGDMDVLWLSWLVFLIPGWTMAFVGFVYAIIIFIVIHKLVLYIARINLKFCPPQENNP